MLKIEELGQTNKEEKEVTELGNAKAARVDTIAG